MKRAQIILLLPPLLAACDEESRRIRGCVREHGTITVEEYLQDKGLDDCPDTPVSSCTGEILSAAAMECVAWELYYMDYRESLDSGPVVSGMDFSVVNEFHPENIAYSSDLRFDDLIWIVGKYEGINNEYSGTRLFGARTGSGHPSYFLSSSLSTPF